MHDAKAMSRLITTMAWSIAVCFPTGVLTAALGFVGTGLRWW